MVAHLTLSQWVRKVIPQYYRFPSLSLKEESEENISDDWSGGFSQLGHSAYCGQNVVRY